MFLAKMLMKRKEKDVGLGVTEIESTGVRTTTLQKVCCNHPSLAIEGGGCNNELTSGARLP